MNKEKNKNIIIGLIIFIIIILIIFIISMVTNKIIFNNSATSDDYSDAKVVEDIDNDSDANVVEDIDNDIINKVEDGINSNWINYLLSLNITNITVSRRRSIATGDDEDFSKDVTISIGKLSNLLSKINNNNLVKVYVEGMGGPNKDSLKVEYEVDGKEYQFKILYGTISVSNLDDEFIKILNDNNYEVSNEEIKDNQQAFYFYSIGNYSSSMFDEYFQ